MGTLINPPVWLAPVNGSEASRDAVSLGTGSVAVGLVGLLEACNCTWGSIRLAAVARVWLHWVWLLAEGLVGGFSEVFNHLKKETASAEDSWV